MTQPQFPGFYIKTIQKPDYTFSGLKRRLHHYPQPTQLIDQYMPDLTGNEFKVLSYICRQTLGFHKPHDTLALTQMLVGKTRRDGSQMDHGIGLCKGSLLRALNGLISKGLVFRQRRSNKSRGDLPSRYGLRFVEQPTTLEATSAQQGRGVAKINHTINSKGVTKQRCRKKREYRKFVKPREQVDYLVDQISQATNDRTSRGGFARMAIHLPDEVVFELLTQLKHRSNIANKGAWFIGAAKRQLKGLSKPQHTYDPTPLYKAENGHPEQTICTFKSSESEQREGNTQSTLESSLAMFTKMRERLQENLALENRVQLSPAWNASYR